MQLIDATEAPGHRIPEHDEVIETDEGSQVQPRLRRSGDRGHPHDRGPAMPSMGDDISPDAPPGGGHVDALVLALPRNREPMEPGRGAVGEEGALRAHEPEGSEPLLDALGQRMAPDSADGVGQGPPAARRHLVRSCVAHPEGPLVEGLGKIAGAGHLVRVPNPATGAAEISTGHIRWSPRAA